MLTRILDAVFGRWFFAWIIPAYTLFLAWHYWGEDAAWFFLFLGFMGTVGGVVAGMQKGTMDRMRAKPGTASFVNIPTEQMSTIGHAVAPVGVYFEYADGQRYENLPTVFVRWDTDDKSGVPCAMFEVIPPRDPEEDRPIAIGAQTWPGRTGLILPKLRDRENPDDS
jgi:hypothetical protein